MKSEEVQLKQSMLLRYNKRSLLKDIYKDWDLYIMLLIPVAFLIIFKYIPMGGLVMVFQNYDIFDGFFNSQWVGLANFRELFSTSEFFNVLRNTLLISLYRLLFFFPLPIILAIMLNEVRKAAFKRTVQTIVYLPHFLSWAVVAGLAYDLLSNNGMLNHIIASFGGERIRFLMEPGLFRTIVVGSAAWKEVGFSAIIYLAAISSIDPTLYEAAVVDGASRLKQIWYVTVPGIAPTIVVMLLVRISWIMDAGSEQILAMYNPTVYETGDVIGTYIYRIGLGSMRYSFAATVGAFNSVVSFAMVVIANGISRKLVNRSIW